MSKKKNVQRVGDIVPNYNISRIAYRCSVCNILFYYNFIKCPCCFSGKKDAGFVLAKKEEVIQNV